MTLIGADVTPQVIKRALSPAARFAIPLTIGWLAILWDLIKTGTSSDVPAFTKHKVRLD